MRRIIPLMILSLSVQAEQPEWTLNTNRQVINDSIVQYGKSWSDSSVMAQFQAEQMAIKSLVDECGGFYHKSIIVRKKYSESYKNGFTAYVQASIDYSSCEYGKTPHAKTNKDVESPTIKESQLLYMKSLTADPDLKQEIINDLNRQNLANQEHINSIEKQVDELRELKNKNIQANVVVTNVTINGTAAKKQECLEQYKELMRDAQIEAMDNGGNLAAGSAAPIYNKAMVKFYNCQKMK
jgi:hypothetical protein